MLLGGSARIAMRNDTAVIQRNWQSLIKPEKLEFEPGSDPSRTALVVAEPLERGFGMTLGNAIRRILLSSLQGAAVTAVQIDGVLHEFSSIPGVREDVTDIVLNVKQLALRMHGEGPKRMVLTATGPGEVKAGQIQAGHDIDIMNPETRAVHARRGREARHGVHGQSWQRLRAGGQQPSGGRADRADPSGQHLLAGAPGVLPRGADARWQPDQLRQAAAEAWRPMVRSLRRTRWHWPRASCRTSLQLFINFDEPQQLRSEEQHDDLPFNRNLLRKVDELELSVRSANCLKNDNIVLYRRLGAEVRAGDAAHPELRPQVAERDQGGPDQHGPDARHDRRWLAARKHRRSGQAAGRAVLS